MFISVMQMDVVKCDGSLYDVDVQLNVLNRGLLSDEFTCMFWCHLVSLVCMNGLREALD